MVRRLWESQATKTTPCCRWAIDFEALPPAQLRIVISSFKSRHLNAWNNSMRLVVLAVALVTMFAFVISSVGEPPVQRSANAIESTSNQMLMRDKLVQMNRILEGITLNNFDEVKEAAKTLGMISTATSWHIADPTPRYERLSKNFQEQAADLERHANERNTDAATLDLVRMNITCTQCHQHMRENAARHK
jgi:hypothetical protein